MSPPPVIVISLPGSPRRATIAAELARIGATFTFWDGVVVGRDTTPAAYLAREFPGADVRNTLNHGTLGCLMAYLHLCRHLASDAAGADATLVLEDDVEFLGDARAWAAFDWDGFRERYGERDWTFLHWYSHLPNATQAQVITRRGAQRVWSRAVEVLNTDEPIDIAIHCRKLFDHADLFQDTGRALFNHLFDPRNPRTSDKFIVNAACTGTVADHMPAVP